VDGKHKEEQVAYAIEYKTSLTEKMYCNMQGRINHAKLIIALTNFISAYASETMMQ